jgi:hypothetical protein
MSEIADINPQLMTFFGLLGSQILAYLQGNGATPQQHLVQWICQLGWSAGVVKMAIDALARGGLVKVEKGFGDSVIKPAERRTSWTTV